MGGATDGLSRSWGCIYGDYRIVNGALFALNFDNASAIARLDPESVDVSVTYGLGYESIEGVLQTPEPGSLLSLATLLLPLALTLLKLNRRRCRNT
jgi:hypothetical protein